MVGNLWVEATREVAKCCDHISLTHSVTILRICDDYILCKICNFRCKVLWSHFFHPSTVATTLSCQNLWRLHFVQQLQFSLQSAVITFLSHIRSQFVTSFCSTVALFCENDWISVIYTRLSEILSWEFSYFFRILFLDWKAKSWDIFSFWMYSQVPTPITL